MDRPNFISVRRRLPYSTQADYRTSGIEFEVEGSPIARVKLPHTRKDAPADDGLHERNAAGPGVTLTTRA